MRPTIVCIGEFLWDRFPNGDRLGGAPANVAGHCAALGAKAYVISAVGTDDLGDHALHELSAKGVDTSLIAQMPDQPTGTVDITMDAGKGHTFTINSPAAWDHIQLSEAAHEVLSRADAIVYGTLGQRTAHARAVTRQIINLVPPSCIRVCDANFRPPHDDHDLLRDLLGVSTVLKINDEELADFAPGMSPEVFFESQSQLDALIYTRGADGALIASRDGIADHPGIETEVIDTVGAGDSFTATCLTGMLQQMPLAQTLEKAIRVAAYVCSQPGATPTLPQDLLR